MKTFNSLSELEDQVGKTLGISEPIRVTQEMIDQFAKLTGDEQYIHIDPKRAASESPYGTTIAHGFLVLSLATKMCSGIFKVNDVKTAINYGVNRVRFPSPTTVDSELIAVAKLQAFNRRSIGVQIIIELEINSVGFDKPTCVAELVTLFFN